LARDEVRLLVSDARGQRHAQFQDLPEILRAGDVLVVNDSATLPASLPGRGRLGDFRLNLSTRYGPRLWLAEPRRSAAQPGPMNWREGEVVVAGGAQVRLLRPYPGIPRLWFVEGDVGGAMRKHGTPIRYAYLSSSHAPPGLEMYQTIFARVPGSAEMPSAARPFTRRLLDALRRRGVQVVTVTLHTGVSSIEADESNPLPVYPEPFHVTHAAADAINAARTAGGRVVAVGTTVARALESAHSGGGNVRAAAGFTRHLVHTGNPPRVFHALLTGFHDPRTTHLALLDAVAGPERVRTAYATAIAHGYLWHEFGDSHLLTRADFLTI
jgi:S-adenosylmethionine:tRNA ribosyltransferase-isomerase